MMRFCPLLFCLLAATTTGCGIFQKSDSGNGDRVVRVEILPPPTDEEQQSRLIQAGAVKDSGDYQEALRLFQEILQDNPSINSATDAFIGIGEIHMARGDYAQAEPAYERAAKISPRSFKAQYGHGVVLQVLGKIVDAIKAFHRALAIDPDNFDANRSMATAYLQIREPQNAIIFAQKAVSLRPDDGASRVNLGAAYAEADRYADAIVQYETAMELMEPTPELMLNLVNAYAKEQRYQETVNTAATLVRIAPSANAYERLGWGYFRLGMYDQSIEAYREGARLDPGHWMSLNGIGVNALNTWLKSNRHDDAARTEAHDAFVQSLRLNPAQPKVTALLTTYGL